MKIESPSFTAADLERFLEELVDEDRRSLIERLRRAAARTLELAPRLREGAGHGAASGARSEAWSAHEVLAHMAVLAKFYGVLTYQIGSGKLTELDLLANVHLRDVAAEQLAGLPAAELAAAVAAEIEKTCGYLERASGAHLERSARLTHGGSITAGQIARLPLCAHLEQHLRQLESALS
jgi:hypothetical protein